MAPMSSIVVSVTGLRLAVATHSLSTSGSHLDPDFDLEDFDFSVERRKERLVRLPNHLKPWEGKSLRGWMSRYVVMCAICCSFNHNTRDFSLKLILCYFISFVISIAIQ